MQSEGLLLFFILFREYVGIVGRIPIAVRSSVHVAARSSRFIDAVKRLDWYTFLNLRCAIVAPITAAKIRSSLSHLLVHGSARSIIHGRGQTAEIVKSRSHHLLLVR